MSETIEGYNVSKDGQIRTSTAKIYKAYQDEIKMKDQKIESLLRIADEYKSKLYQMSNAYNILLSQYDKITNELSDEEKNKYFLRSCIGSAMQGLLSNSNNMGGKFTGIDITQNSIQYGTSLYAAIIKMENRSIDA